MVEKRKQHKTTIMTDSLKELFSFNISTLFLLQPLGLQWKELRTIGFCNCYLRDEAHPEYEGLQVVMLLFEVKDQDGFRLFVDKEKERTPHFIDEYDHEDNYVVLVYDFPDDLTEDYERIKRGEYSKLSQKYQATLQQTVEVTILGSTGLPSRKKSHTTQYMIIRKTPEWKALLEDYFGSDINFDDGREFWKVMDMTEETITIPPKKRVP